MSVFLILKLDTIRKKKKKKKKDKVSTDNNEV